MFIGGGTFTRNVIGHPFGIREVVYANVELVHDCWTKEDLTDISDRLAAGKDAIAELIQVTKSCVTKLKSSIMAGKKEVAEKSQKLKVTSAAKKKEKERGSRQTGVHLHDIGFAAAKQMEFIPLGTATGPGAKPMGYDVPFVISINADHEILLATSEVRKTVDKFAAKFEASKRQRIGNGTKDVGDYRAQRAIPKENTKPLSDLMYSIVGSALQVPIGSLPLSINESMAMGVYGIERDYSQTTQEKDHFGGLRLCIIGTRSIVMAQTSHVSQFYRGQFKKDANETVALKKVSSSFHSFTADDAKSFIKQFPMYAATVAPGECLFIPAGFTMSEVVHSEKDHYGFRLNSMFVQDLPVLKDLGDELALLSGKIPATLMLLDGLDTSKFVVDPSNVAALPAAHDGAGEVPPSGSDAAAAAALAAASASSAVAEAAAVQAKSSSEGDGEKSDDCTPPVEPKQ
jgi:hypothetical protein